MKKVKEQLDGMVNDGIIESVTEPSEWCSPMVIAPKSNGDIRLCVDLSRLNDNVQREHFPLPSVDHLLGQIPPDARYFSKFRFMRLPFGITTGPEVFQRDNIQIYATHLFIPTEFSSGYDGYDTLLLLSWVVRFHDD